MAEVKAKSKKLIYKPNIPSVIKQKFFVSGSA